MSIVIRSMMLLQAEARADQRDAVGHGGDKLKALSSRRDMNRKAIEDRGAKADELESDLAKVNDRNFLVVAGHWLIGYDPAGEVNEKQLENQAGLEKSQEEIEVMRSEQKSIFREIERAEQNVTSTGSEANQMLAKRERTIRDPSL